MGHRFRVRVRVGARVRARVGARGRLSAWSMRVAKSAYLSRWLRPVLPWLRPVPMPPASAPRPLVTAGRG